MEKCSKLKNDNFLCYNTNMDKQEFESAQKKLEKKIREVAVRERKSKLKLYFEFKNPKARNNALNLLNKLNEERKDFDERFLYFEGCLVDPQRPDDGIEIKFSKTVPGLRDKMESLLAEHGLMPAEEYETIEDEPQPGETRINKP